MTVTLSHMNLAQIDLRPEIVGVNQAVPLLDGSSAPYVNLDNAASTPTFRRVQEKTEEFAAWYSSVHRGSGFKSMLSTQIYEEARTLVLNFVGADPEQDCLIFCKNTTEALNKLAKRFPFQPGDMVLTTGMEHHSNDLPWRARAQVLHTRLLPGGELDMADLRANLAQYAGRIKLVAVTGASNVTGIMPPIYEIAQLAHAHGAQIVVDCAQLMPHRKIDMRPHHSPAHLDFIAFSAHKLYAPFGSGGLIGRTQFFNQGEPDVRGGGTVEMVTLTDVIWTGAPEREEAGSPNVVGAVALAASIQFLSEIGMDQIARHEAELTRYALEQLSGVPGVILYGAVDVNQVENRVGVIPFGLDGITHGKLAAILSYEGGIGVRNGCFCAHPYILHLLGVTNEEFLQFRAQVTQHNRADLPGLVRMSFGCYNNRGDVDRLVDMLDKIRRGKYQGNYQVDPQSGSYYPSGFTPTSIWERYFQF